HQNLRNRAVERRQVFTFIVVDVNGELHEPARAFLQTLVEGSYELAIFAGQELHDLKRRIQLLRLHLTNIEPAELRLFAQRRVVLLIAWADAARKSVSFAHRDPADQLLQIVTLRGEFLAESLE